MYKNSFDKNLKSTMDLNDYYIEPSKNIFEEAWNKRDREESRQGDLKMHLKLVVASSICFLVLGTASILCMSKDARAFAKEAYNNIRTIFILEKSKNDYKIVQKSEEAVELGYNFGGTSITDSNIKACEKRVGFPIYCPEKIGSDFDIHTNAGVPHIMLGLRVFNIKLDDAENLNKKFFMFIEDGVESKEIKGYKKKLGVSSCYSDNKGHNYMIRMKKNDDLNEKLDSKDAIKEFNIENINYKVFEQPRTFVNLDGYLYPSDCKVKPDKIIKSKYISWVYNEIEFSLINLNNNQTDIDNAIEFIGEYMKLFKQQKL